MAHRFSGRFAAVGLLGFCLAGLGPAARADLVIDATVGGAPTGVSYVNFNDLTPGDRSTAVSGGITVTFGGDAQPVTGSVPNVYAAPYLSDGNGLLFGDPNDGPDQTVYLATGVGSITLSLPGPEMYFGLLWGSVDDYNTLQLYSGHTLVGTVTGSDVTAGANGDQGANGTFYVNINSTTSFDTVVATSSNYAFEFDNVAFNPMQVVPEPSSFVLALVGVVGVAGYRQLHRKGRAAGAGA